MTLIADSSFVYALTNPYDSRHQAAVNFASALREVTLVPDIVLPEIAYLFRRDVGTLGIPYFLRRFREYDSVLVSLSDADLDRISDIAETYADAEFDIVDCCIMAIAERLDINRIATFDRRDFGIFRPRHCEFLELLP